LKNNALIIKI